MPNWCYNDITIYPHEGTGLRGSEQLRRLHSVLDNPPVQLKSIDGVRNDFGLSWLGNIAASHGFDPVRTEGARGEIRSIEFAEGAHVRFLTETAWAPHIELWERVLEQYPDLQMVYTAFEPGNGIFINTDLAGHYYPSRVKCESWADSWNGDKDWENPFPPSSNFKRGTTPWDVFGNDGQYFRDFDALTEHLASKMYVNDVPQFKTAVEVESFLGKAIDEYKQFYSMDEDDNFHYNVFVYDSE